MADLKWLDYSGQSTDELLALENEFRTDSLVCAIEQALYQRASVQLYQTASDQEVESFTEEEYVVLAVEALEREVNNGGYDQFFRNSSNEFSPVIVNALNEIGRIEAAALTQEAIDALEIEGPVSTKAIDQAMEKKSDHRDQKLSECDNRYYETVGDLSKPLLEFVRKNKNQIRLRA